MDKNGALAGRIESLERRFDSSQTENLSFRQSISASMGEIMADIKNLKLWAESLSKELHEEAKKREEEKTQESRDRRDIMALREKTDAERKSLFWRRLGAIITAFLAIAAAGWKLFRTFFDIHPK